MPKKSNASSVPTAAPTSGGKDRPDTMGAARQSRGPRLFYLIDNQERSVLFRKGRAQAPDRYTFRTAARDWPAVLLVQLPGHRATPLPRGPFRPGQEDLTASIHGERRMSAVLRSSERDRGRHDLLRNSACNPGELNLSGCLPGAEDRIGRLGQRKRTHRARADLPFIELRRDKPRAVSRAQ